MLLRSRLAPVIDALAIVGQAAISVGSGGILLGVALSREERWERGPREKLGVRLDLPLSMSLQLLVAVQL